MEGIMKFAFCLIAAIVCLAVGIMQLNERGTPLNNAYLYASKEKKQSMNKSPYFKQSGIVFILLAVIFTLLASSIAFRTAWLEYLSLGVCAVAVIYAVVSSVIIEKSVKRIFRFRIFGFFRHE